MRFSLGFLFSTAPTADLYGPVKIFQVLKLPKHAMNVGGCQWFPSHR
jgi:hypothetical protein